MRSRVTVVAWILVGLMVSGGWLLESGFQGRDAGTAAGDWIFASRWLGGAGGLGGVGRIGQGGEGRRVFADVLDHVDKDFVDSMGAGQIYQKAIDGMLYELGDPHTAYLSPARLRRLTESTTGIYIGLGIQIDIRDGWITVMAPLPGTPAERAGIETGDRVVEIDGKSTHDWTQDEAAAVLHGTPGTTVHLMIERPGVDSRIPFTLTRREIHVRAAQHAAVVGAGVGYVDLTIFSDSTVRELRQAIDSLRGQGMRTLILDLRNDPGGLLAQGVAVSDLFLPSGKTVVTMKGRAREASRAFVSDAAEPWPSLGVIVLVNGATASAAEIVAGALQDHDRALILGSTTYGKGSAQTLYHIDSGALKLTTALWYTPSGRSINRPPIRANDDEGDDDGGETAPVSVGGRSASADSAAARPVFRTDAGRVVYGGGGITPDVSVRDTIAEARDSAFRHALGTQFGLFRDALTSYALSMKADHQSGVGEINVTPAMREELWRRMRDRGVKMDRRTYDRLSPSVDHWLATETDRILFGSDVSFRAALKTDPVFQTALGIAARAKDSRDLVLHPAVH
jgi:carboxyl-terminal processing protease